MRNVAVAVSVLVIVSVALAAVYFSSVNSQKSQASAADQALSVGDTFTYKLTGSTVLGNSDVVTPIEFMQYNNTDYYRVTVTKISGTQVWLDTEWQFNNGTQVASVQIIDLSTGTCADLTGFVYLYPSNLTVSSPLFPFGTSGLSVNSTSVQKFSNCRRAIDCWSTEDQFVNSADQTGNTMRYDFIIVNFDKQTGMLVDLTRIEFFTNPEIELTINWELTSSNVWLVK